MQCPNCRFETDSTTECPKCGIVFEKFARHHTEHASPLPPVTATAEPPRKGYYSPKQIIVGTIFCLVFAKYLPTRSRPGLLLEMLNRKLVELESPQRANRAAALPHDKNGFVEMPPSTGFVRGKVYVLAAVGCPKEDAQRADQLYADLASRQIPAVRSDSFQFSLSDPSQADTVNAVMGGPLPVVFVRGRAKNNPTLKEVLAEYRQDEE